MALPFIRKNHRTRLDPRSTPPYYNNATTQQEERFMNQAEVLDVREFINARKMSAFQWGLVVLCF
jgi:hypothetical protein